MQRYSFSQIKEAISIPNLIQTQLSSYDWFVREGLRSSLEEIFPISDFTGNLELDFWGYELGEPKYGERESKERDVSY